MNEWKTVRLGDVATYINGYAFKPSDWGTTGLPIIRIQNLTGNDYETNFFNGEIHPKYTVKDGDVLISWSASLGVYEWNKGNALLNQHIFKVVFDKIEVDKKYFIFTVSHLLNEMAKHTHGSTMRHITKPDFDNMPFPLPSIKEQKKISELLEKCTSIIASNKQMLEKYDMLIKSRFIEMFGDNQTLEFQTLENICSIITDGTHQPPKFTTTGIPFLFVSNIAGNKITYKTEKFISEKTYEELYKRTPIEIGDVLLSTVGSYGHPAIVETDNKFLFQRHIAYLKPKKDFINSIYFHGALLSPDAQKQIEERVKGIAQKTLNLSEIRKIKIPVPPIELQNDFAVFVQQIDKSKFAVQKSLEKAETLYKSLMQEYFG